MADRYAVQSGVWSDPATWDGGTLPEPGDTVRPSGKTVTIDMDIEVDELRNDAASPATQGGRFEVADGEWVIDADVTARQSFLLVVPAGATVTATGDVSGGALSGARGVDVEGSLSVVGNVAGGSGSSAYGVYVSGGSLSVVGNVVGGSYPGAYGVQVAGSGSLSVVGDVAGGSYSNVYGVGVSGGSATITGEVRGSSNANGVGVTGGSVTITGSVIDRGVDASGGVVDIDGTVEATTLPAVTGNSSGLIRFTGPLINSPTGISASTAARWMIRENHNFEWQVTNDSTAPVSGDPVHLTVWNDHTPPPEDTRAGHVYGHGGTLTGTLDVPPPESVAAGVPTDDTVGSAALAPSDVWDQQPDRLKNVATVATTGVQLEAALDTGDDS